MIRGGAWPEAVSVVVPTYDRAEELGRVLTALDRQHVPEGVEMEVVVVDDGSTDGTRQMLDGWTLQSARLEVLRQPNAGPARARNLGARTAGGELLAFLGDDTVPRGDWLLHHLEEHRMFGAEGPLAVLGYTCFPPGATDPFLRYINEFGAQFGYLLIDDPTSVPFNFFYTSNISLPRWFLLDLGGFREDFPAAAWEDIEFAFRAFGSGLRMRYQPRARTVHHHRIRPRTFCSRQRTSGRSAAIFARLHPELEDFLGVNRVRRGEGAAGVRLALLDALVRFATRGSLVLPAGVYRAWLDSWYLRGLAGGLQQNPARR